MRNRCNTDRYKTTSVTGLDWDILVLALAAAKCRLTYGIGKPPCRAVTHPLSSAISAFLAETLAEISSPPILISPALRIVARASRPRGRGHSFAPLRTGSARAREREAPATAGGTPAPHLSTVG